jgi:hypothetical protein
MRLSRQQIKELELAFLNGIVSRNVMTVRQVSATLFSILFVAAVVSAQGNQCGAKMADLPQAPELRGFRLGMTFEQAKTRVPQIVFGHTDEFGLSKTSINPDFDLRIDKTNFEDVRTVSLEFLDGRVTSLWIGYENSFKWKTADEFVKGISPALGVPIDWTAKSRAQQLKCVDFELSVSVIAGGPSLRIVDLPAAETLVARRQAKEDAAEAQEAAPAQTPVTGDTGNKTYYPVGCQSLKDVPEKKRIAFNSQEEAEKAGYKRSSSCP